MLSDFAPRSSARQRLNDRLEKCSVQRDVPHYKEAERSDPLRHYWYSLGEVTQTLLSCGSEAPHHDAED